MNVCPSFDFSEALRLLKSGRHVRRFAWPNSLLYVGVVEPSLFSDTQSRHFYIMDNFMTDKRIMSKVYMFTYDDILANDWYTVTI